MFILCKINHIFEFEMRNFENNILYLFSLIYSGNIKEDNNNSLSDFSVFSFPDKKVAFHLISTHNPTLNYNFNSLTEKYSQQGIRLIHLWEDLWTQKQNIIESRIKLILGNFTRIHARQTTVKRIDKNLLDDFLNSNHLYGSPTAKYKYGLFFNNRLVAAASFSAMRTYWRNEEPYQSAELVRFANCNGYAVAGGFSKLLTHFIREQQPDDIMSYADRDWSDGKSYEKVGFEKIEITSPQQFWLHPAEQMRYYAHRLPQHLLTDFDKDTNDLTIEEYLVKKGYFKIYNTGNIKYLQKLK